MSDANLPECLSCGACCFGQIERYVAVSGDDHLRLGDAADALTVFVENRCYMRMHDGHCAALQLTPAGRFVCSVYEQRPAVCRELARGGPACEAERVQKRERAGRALLPVLTVAPFSARTSK
jgi:Fe-S-cluster containining protein